MRKLVRSIVIASILFGAAGFIFWSVSSSIESRKKQKLEQQLNSFANLEIPDVQRLIDDLTNQIDARTASITGLLVELENLEKLSLAEIGHISNDCPIEYFTTGAIIRREDIDGSWKFYNPQPGDEIREFLVRDGPPFTTLHPQDIKRTAPGKRVRVSADFDLINWIWGTQQLRQLKEELLESRESLYLAYRKSKLTPGNDAEYLDDVKQAQVAAKQSTKMFQEIQRRIEMPENEADR